MPKTTTSPSTPQRTGKSQTLGAVLGFATEGPKKRVTLIGNYEEPHLPFAPRMQWLAKVQLQIAESSAKHESYPHKLASVARVLAYVGDVCRPSIEHIAHHAGCAPNTVNACIKWLEGQGAITWQHTGRKHTNGRMVRSTNLYTLVLNFRSLVASVSRAIREIWRERPSAVSKGNECPGETRPVTDRERSEALKHLAKVAEARNAQLKIEWNKRYAT